MSRRRRRDEISDNSGAVVIHPFADRKGTVALAEEDMKQLTTAAQLVVKSLSYDEKRSWVLDQINSYQNGKYVYYLSDKFRLSLTRIVPIPQAIFDYYEKDLKYQSFVGLLPEINRAYITIDNKLFLWNYHDGNDFCVYSKLQQIIISVALVRPKPGVFVSSIKYVLVIATPVEIVMLGVCFEDNNEFGELSLYETQFCVPSDNVNMLKIIGTDNGRVLMCGMDGCVYELQYQAEDGWFTNKKCRKVNHSHSRMRSLLPNFLFGSSDNPIVDIVVDHSRDRVYLYTLGKHKGKNCVVQVFDMGPDGEEMKLVTTNNSVAQQCGNIMNKNGRERRSRDWDPENFEIVSISGIPRTEGEKVVLMAVTEHGHRIFFSMIKNGWQDTIAVKTIRLCVPYTEAPQDEHLDSGRSRRSEYEPFYRQGTSPKCVHKSYYNNGVLLLADAQTSGDALIGIVPDSVASVNGQRYLNESVESRTRPMDRRISDIAEVPSSFYMSFAASCLYAGGFNRPLDGLTEFATQHALPPRQFLCLTSSGLYMFAKSRPVDELRNILERQSKTSHEDELEHFFQQYGVKESGAMCLIIATAPTMQALTHEASSDSKYETGDRSLRMDGGGGAGAASLDRVVKNLAKQAFFRYGSQDLNRSDQKDGRRRFGGRVARQQVFSGKVEGLVLYLSRLLRPVWDWTIAVPTDKSNTGQISLRFTTDQLNQLQSDLIHLKRFLRENNRLLYGTGGRRDSNLMDTGHGVDTEKERHVIDSLLDLLHLSIEGMSLLGILAQTNFTKVIAQLSDSDRYKLIGTHFYELVTSMDGQSIARALIDSMMVQNSDSAQWVNELHGHCPTFFGLSDLLDFKAKECIEKAKEHFGSRKERDQFLAQALDYYHTAARNRQLPLEKICFHMRSVHYYTGVVELCLFRAKLLHNGEISGPSLKGGEAYRQEDEDEFRLSEMQYCYDRILETLDILYHGHYSNPKEAQIVNKQGILTAPERTLLQDKVLTICLDSDDPRFHDQLYRWFIKYDHKDRLFKIKSKYLLQFLTENEEYVQILNEYYLRNNMYEHAAKLLCELSKKKTDKFTLADRYSHLSRALLCAKKCVDSAGRGGANATGNQAIDGDMVFNLRDRIEIAKIQQKIHSRLSAIAAQEPQNSKRRDEAQKCIQELDFELFDIDPLYMYSSRFELYECCLAIIFFSGERTRTEVVRALWKNIIRIEIFKATHPRSNLEGKDEKYPDASLDQADWTVAVEDRLCDLCKLYMNAGSWIFPLEFIVRELEFDNFEYQRVSQRGFAVNALLKAGIPCWKLIDVYNRIIETSANMQLEERVLLFWSVYYLLEQLYKQQRSALVGGARALLYSPSKVFDIIGKCLMDLGCITSDDSQQLHSRFQSLYKRFDRR